MKFEKVERKKAKLRLQMSGPSGSGKTYSSLLIGYGITHDWGKIALIDTERGSGELYANLGEYLVGSLEPPFTPQKYIDAIKSAEQVADVIIIDSLSHAWSGEGGLLDMQDTASKTNKNNSFTAWREITPVYNKLVDTILQSSSHIIITTRTKTEYILTENEKGKQTPKKVGLAPVFRDGLEYEMTVAFDISLDHVASTSKDRTGLFDGVFFKPTSETGELLANWLNNGVEAPKVICPQCGIEMRPITMKDGSQKTAKEFLEQYHMCADCVRKEYEENQKKENQKEEGNE